MAVGTARKHKGNAACIATRAGGIQDNHDIGAPGVGKTATLWHFKNTEAPNSYVVKATAGEGGAWNLACALCTFLDLGTPDGRDLAGARHLIADDIGPDGFLIIDEAQYLVQKNPRGPDHWDALEWARGMSEDGFFGMAFIGDMKLDAIIHDLPQLKRRTHPRVTISYSTEKDVTAFCHARGVSDPGVIRRLFAVAKRFGGIGDLTEIFSTASDMCGGSIPAPDDIYAALEFLNFAKGGRS